MARRSKSDKPKAPPIKTEAVYLRSDQRDNGHETGHVAVATVAVATVVSNLLESCTPLGCKPILDDDCAEVVGWANATSNGAYAAMRAAGAETLTAWGIDAVLPQPYETTDILFVIPPTEARGLYVQFSLRIAKSLMPSPAPFKVRAPSFRDLSPDMRRWLLGLNDEIHARKRLIDVLDDARERHGLRPVAFMSACSPAYATWSGHLARPNPRFWREVDMDDAALVEREVTRLMAHRVRIHERGGNAGACSLPYVTMSSVRFEAP